MCTSPGHVVMLTGRVVVLTAVLTLVTAKGRVMAPNNYLSVDVDCREDRIKVLARTLDPFSGVVYVERPQVVKKGVSEVGRGCRVRGGGGHEIGLSVRRGECGWKNVGETKVSLHLYLQYDVHVQQVIDETLEVECDMRTREGKVRLPGNSISLGQAFINTVEDELEDVVSPLTLATQYTIVDRKENKDHQPSQKRTLDDTSFIPLATPLKEALMNPLKETLSIPLKETLSTPSKETLATSRTMEDKYAALQEYRDRINQADTHGDKPVESAASTTRGWMEVWAGGAAGHLEGGTNATLLIRTWGDPAPRQTKLGACTIKTEVGVFEITDSRGCGRGLTGRSSSRGVEQLSHTFTLPPATGSATIACKVVGCTDCSLKCRERKLEKEEGKRLEEEEEEVLYLETQVSLVGGEKHQARIEQMEVEEKYIPTPSILEQLQSGNELCLSPSRLILLFGVLILVLVLALLAACLLWIKARSSMRIMRPRPPGPLPRHRPPYMLPPRSAPYIRVNI